MTTSSRSRLILAVSLAATAVLSASSRAAADPVPITTCGETMETDVYLTGDLDCSGSPGHGIDFILPARLNLNGFSIRNANLYGVQCRVRCNIDGPGGIVDSAQDGVRIANSGRIRNVVISGNGSLAVEVANNPGGGRVRVIDSTIANNGAGVSAQRGLRLLRTTVTGNSTFGVAVPLYTDGCGGGVRVSLSGSTVSGNSTAPGCGGNFDCVDILSCNAPRLDDASSCGTSASVETGMPWGDCSLD